MNKDIESLGKEEDFAEDIPSHGDKPIKSNRLVTKTGAFRVKLDNATKLVIKQYIRDAFTTLVDAKWRWTIFIFIMGFLLTWLIFAILYLIFSLAHGDPAIIKLGEAADDAPCMFNVYDFPSAFLFSVETQHTIGYGFRGLSTSCPHVIVLAFVQFVIGLGVQTLIAALVFSKLQRGKRRGETVVFSQKACIGKVDGQWRLMVRVGDFRRSQLVGARAKGIMIKRSETTNSKQEYFEQVFIDFKSEGGSNILTLLWPAIIYHTIDSSSPLWPPEKLDEFGGFSELIVLLEGVISSTSRTVQVRTSYIPEEMHFGYRFQTICPQIRYDDKYECSYFDFNTIIPIISRRPKSRKKEIKKRVPRPITVYN